MHVCAYRSKDGLKCAIGAIAEDSEIDFIGEDKPVADFKKYFTRFDDLNEYFLFALQAIHDYAWPSRWLERLSGFATKYKLDKSVLKQFRKVKTTV